jgi:hypothetical protein
MLIAVAGSPSAHHSHANYWETEWIDLEGTVQEVHWMNPHTWIHLQVLDADGKPRAWALEGAGVTALHQDGLREESVRVGDVLSVRCHPLKDGSRGCLLGFITLADGTEREFD